MSLPALQKIQQLQACMEGMAKEGVFTPYEFELKHHFTGSGQYAREMFIPKGYLLVGKMHKHAHFNFVLKGKIAVATDEDKKIIEAPCVFVSQPGVKRIGYALEDTIWVTVHNTENQDLALIEDEVIVKQQDELSFTERLALE